MDNKTWHDQRPSHPPVSHAVTVAHEHAKIAQKVYDDYVDECLNNPGVIVNWSEIDRLGKIANDADKVLLAARHDALNPCTCTPLSDACPVCLADNKERYDSIPFGGE